MSVEIEGREKLDRSVGRQTRCLCFLLSSRFWHRTDELTSLVDSYRQRIITSFPRRESNRQIQDVDDHFICRRAEKRKLIVDLSRFGRLLTCETSIEERRKDKTRLFNRSCAMTLLQMLIVRSSYPADRPLICADDGNGVVPGVV